MKGEIAYGIETSFVRPINAAVESVGEQVDDFGMCFGRQHEGRVPICVSRDAIVFVACVDEECLIVKTVRLASALVFRCDLTSEPTTMGRKPRFAARCNDVLLLSA